MEHSEYQELLAAQALDALDVSEARMLSAHLDSCAVCRDELAELREAASLLAHAPEPAAPGDEVRRRIMRDIQSQASSQTSQVVPLSHGLSAAWPNVLRLAAAFTFFA